jgi:hypothetical protein
MTRDDYLAHWDQVRSRSREDGTVHRRGTCDEIGRRQRGLPSTGHGPVSLSISLIRVLHPALATPRTPPKALIHRNVPGENVHRFLGAMDRAWLDAAPLAAFGARQRWSAMCRALAADGWPLLDSPSRWRLGEVTVAWDAVAPVPAAVP